MPQKTASPLPPRDTSAQVNRNRAANKSSQHSQNVSDRLLETLIDNMRVLGKDANPQNIDDYTKNPYYKGGYGLDKVVSEDSENEGYPNEGFLMPAPKGWKEDFEMPSPCSTDLDCETKFGPNGLPDDYQNYNPGINMLVRRYLQRESK